MRPTAIDLGRRTLLRRSDTALVAVATVLLLASSCGRSDELRCGPGTIEQEGICIPGQRGGDESNPAPRTEGPVLACGDGTFERENECLPMPERCGPGVFWEPSSARCVLDTEAVCGPGTTPGEGGVICTASPDRCGPGTVADGGTGTCVLATGVCGPGSSLDADSGTCVVSGDNCGARTRWDEEASRCVPSESVCGPGTRWLTFANGCLPDEEPGSRCGANTVWDEERLLCVPDAALCTDGTVRDEDGNCLPSEEICAEGTTWDPEARRCMLTESSCAEGTAYDAASGVCIPTADVCGEGTDWNAQTSRCEALGIVCGEGTVLDPDSGRCLVDASGCGEGTTLDDASGTCVPAPGACGPGTEWNGDSQQCVFARTGCLEGTRFDEDLSSCVPSEDVCGPGTTWIPDRRVCVAGNYVDGSCDDPPELEIPSGDVILARGSCFLVDGSVTIGGNRLLTVEPGVTLLFTRASSMLVGNRGSGSANPLVRMIGTEDEPIRLRGTQASAGWWRGLVISQTNDPDGVLEHVIIEHAGDQPWDEGVPESRAGLLLESNFQPMRIALRHVTTADNEGYGISIRSGRTPAGLCSQVTYLSLEDFENITSTGNSVAPIRILADLVGHIDEATTLTGNADDRVHVYSVSCRSIFHEQTWRNPGVPYRIVSDLTLAAAGNLIMEEGVELHFLRDRGFDLRGRIHVRGTEDAPVLLRSEEFVPNSWRGVRIADNNRPENLIEHMVILEAGNSAWGNAPQAGLVIDPVGGAVATGLRHVRVEDSAGNGLVIRPGNIILHAFEANTFTGNAARPVVLPAAQAGVLDEASSYAGNAIDSIAISGIFDEDVTLRNLEVPWEATAELRVRNSATLTIDAGTRIQFRLNTWLRVGESLQPGFLRVLGTPDSPVILEGTTPVAGWWRGLLIGNSLNPLNEINHLTVRHGGSEGWGGALEAANVHLSRSAGNSRLSVRGLRLEDGLGAGLFLDGLVDLLSCEEVTFDGVDPRVIGSVEHFEASCGPLEPGD
ncbi:MAG: hypothetical protein EA398_16585 [Deltaproteobacteria bacterium]|nr:MAG: hypothetical protein EA398_16585 [Deltaproteobacteria bacterium]